MLIELSGQQYTILTMIVILTLIYIWSKIKANFPPNQKIDTHTHTSVCVCIEKWNFNHGFFIYKPLKLKMCTRQLKRINFGILLYPY